jgi:putative transposase
VQHLLTMARENPSWGYTRRRGALENLGFDLGRSTIQRILSEHGIDPAPLRGRTMPWKTFLKAH